MSFGTFLKIGMFVNESPQQFDVLTFADVGEDPTRIVPKVVRKVEISHRSVNSFSGTTPDSVVTIAKKKNGVLKMWSVVSA